MKLLQFYWRMELIIFKLTRYYTTFQQFHHKLALPYINIQVGDAPYSLAKKRGHKKVCEELEAYDSRKRPSVRTVSMQQWITVSFL